MFIYAPTKHGQTFSVSGICRTERTAAGTPAVDAGLKCEQLTFKSNFQPVPISASVPPNIDRLYHIWQMIVTGKSATRRRRKKRNLAPRWSFDTVKLCSKPQKNTPRHDTQCKGSNSNRHHDCFADTRVVPVQTKLTSSHVTPVRFKLFSTNSLDQFLLRKQKQRVQS